MQTCDIAVTGGGLAGLCLAIQAAEAGYQVALFEKEDYPFHKVCGEYISMESAAFLDRIGLTDKNIYANRINKLELTDTVGHLYNFPLPLGGFGISRFTLDYQLYLLALQKNVQVHTGTRVTAIDFDGKQFTLVTSKGSFSAAAAAGSFGKRSNLDARWKRAFMLQKANRLNNYIGVKYHVRYPVSSHTIALHNFKNGYCGISPVEDGKCCLCYLTTAENLSRSNNSIRQMETQVLSKNPFLKKIFEEAVFLYPEPLTIAQISFAKKTQVENHVLMTGDAAGMITPVCGNGMSMAMHASKLAFVNIDQFLQGDKSRGEMEENYTKQWNQHFKTRLFTGRIVQQLFGNETTTSLFLKTMQRLPALANALIRATHGDTF